MRKWDCKISVEMRRNDGNWSSMTFTILKHIRFEVLDKDRHHRPHANGHPQVDYHWCKPWFGTIRNQIKKHKRQVKESKIEKLNSTKWTKQCCHWWWQSSYLYLVDLLNTLIKFCISNLWCDRNTQNRFECVLDDTKEQCVHCIIHDHFTKSKHGRSGWTCRQKHEQQWETFLPLCFLSFPFIPFPLLAFPFL